MFGKSVSLLPDKTKHLNAFLFDFVLVLNRHYKTSYFVSGCGKKFYLARRKNYAAWATGDILRRTLNNNNSFEDYISDEFK